MSNLPVNVDVLKTYVGDNPEIIAQFLSNFRVWANESAQKVVSAQAARDCAEIAAQAHQLKSSARSMGALKLGALCEQLEQAGKSADMTAAAEIIPTFQAEVARVLDYLAR
ncbi:MAG: Hpt domain-containing protein [Burkholderiaceae bacterium]|nr:Hpt domain-containing protein [Burkholderiaceae bacterium]MDH3460622.1 Hpt domain-containing protein [Burkholderiaceae bacterium]